MPRTALKRSHADLPVQPPEMGESKQSWVYRQIAGAISSGLLKPGDAVPSTRALALRWAVSRGVAELAFERLRAEGYLITAAGRATTVAKKLPDHFLRATLPDGPAPAGSTDRNATLSSGRGSSEPGLVQSAQPGRPFVARLPDVGLFDLPEWRRCVQRASRRLDREILAQFEPQGLFELRAGICDHLAVTRGIGCQPDDVVVVTGIRHGIDLCVQVAVPPGGRVAVENPGYSGAETIFQLRGCASIQVDVDADGIVMSQLASHDDVAMAYVTPAHQAPTGVTLSSARRADLLTWADRNDAWVFEDDYDSDFSYEAAPLAALKSIDTHDRVIFCGSFNKVMFPGLRIGYLVAPRALVPRLVSARAATGRSNPVLDQLALVEFMTSGGLLRHLKKTRLVYKQRRDLIVVELRKELGDIRLQGIHAGMHFVLTLPAGLSEAAAIAAAGDNGLAVQGLDSFSHGRAGLLKPGLVIGYTALATTQAKWAARRLAKVLARIMAL